MKFKHKNQNKILVVDYDELAESPREWDNLSIMAIKSREFNLSDNLDFDIPQDLTFEEFEEYLIKEQKAVLTIPLWLYNHSGISLSTSSICRWDSSPIGYAFVTKEILRKEFNVKNITNNILEKAKKIIMGEIETYNKYLSGEVFSYSIYEIKKCELGHTHKEYIESCGGFFGLDEIWNYEDKEEWEEI